MQTPATYPNLSLLLFSFMHNARIKTEARVVHKNTSVYFTGVNLHHVAFDNCEDGAFQIKRNTQIFCQMIKSSEGKYAKSLLGAQNSCRDRVDCSVTTTRHDDFGITSSCALCEFCDLGSRACQ